RRWRPVTHRSRAPRTTTRPDPTSISTAARPQPPRTPPDTRPTRRKPMSAANPVYVGMDLGTFKTSVASSSGYRDVLQTAVGWPKDHIARTMLGRDVVFGKDIVEHRLALDVVRPFEKGALKYVDAAAAGMTVKQTQKH